MMTEGLPVLATPHEDDLFFFDPQDLDALLVTHAHDDHMGRIHLLIDAGFDGPIIMTDVTAEITRLKMQSAVEWWDCANGAAKRHVLDVLDESSVPVGYGEAVQITDNVTATFINAGHLPGSASIIVSARDQGGPVVVFSGDIGSGLHPFLDGPDLASLHSVAADVLVIESTYGSLVRGDEDTGSEKTFLEAVESAISAGQLVIVPTFALDRTQRVLATLRSGMNTRPELAGLRVAVGGLSSCQFTELYADFQVQPDVYDGYFSSEFWTDSSLAPVFWEYTRGDDCSSREITVPRDPRVLQADYDVIVTPSGFGNSSLAEDLLFEYVDEPGVAFFKVGWAPEDSPMGRLEEATVSNASWIRLNDYSAEVPMKCGFHDIAGFFSGHADQDGLTAYALALGSVDEIWIGHGEPSSSAALQSRLQSELPTVNVEILEWGVPGDLEQRDFHSCARAT